MNAHALHRHTLLALFLFGSASALACSDDGDPGTPAGGLQLGEGGNGQGSSPSDTDGDGGSDAQTGPDGGTGGTGGSGGTGGASSKGGSKGGSGGTGGTGGTSSKGGSGGTSSKGGSGGTGGGGTFDFADAFTNPDGSDTACSSCLRPKCQAEITACGAIGPGANGACNQALACVADTYKDTDPNYDCAIEACVSTYPTVPVNDMFTCMGYFCSEECFVTENFASCGGG